MKLMNKIKKLSLIMITVALFAGCKNKNKDSFVNEDQTVNLQKVNHTWYTFTKDNFESIEKPQDSSMLPMTPWTEAVRISSAGNCSGSGVNESKAYAIVNRLGVLTFDNENISLSKDINLFSDRTCGNVAFINDIPIYTVYKSSFFNESVTNPDYAKDNSQHLFLVQFDETARISYPILNCNNLTDEANSEVTDSYWDGENWFCCIKTSSDVKNTFSYIKWKPATPLLSISPILAKNEIIIDEIDVDTFRNVKEHRDFSMAPERIKKLLAGFAKDVPFTLELQNAGGSSTRTYYNAVEESEKKELRASGILSESWSCVLFEDGTLYIEGALPGKHILRGGKPVAIRLPKLPAGYLYSDFVISGTTLYAGWEESSFYQTARSGFLQVNLDKSLYSKLL